jgi:glycosyltransferase involved in cell wall biosynthesis
MLISCVMPTRNRARWVPLAIECFLAQTYQDTELVILDNGDDDTASLVPDNPRIRYERQPGARLCTGEMRNLANELTRGEIICHMDDDDWSAPDRIETQLKQLHESGKQVVGFHSISYWDASPGNMPPEQRAFQYRGTRPYACGTSQFYYKDYWQKHKFPSKQAGEDSLFSSAAKTSRILDSFDGTQLIVARAHSENTFRLSLGKQNLNWFPRVGLQEMPPGFLKAIGLL